MSDAEEPVVAPAPSSAPSSAPAGSPKRLAIGIGAVICLALLGWASFRVLSSDDVAGSQLIGKPAPVVALPDAESGEVFDVTAPGKVLVVNFWAPWCIPCRPEHQLLNRLALELSPDDVTIVGISYQSDPSDVSTFLDDVGRNLRTFTDAQGLAAIEFGVTGVPESFIVDSTGVVRHHVVGPMNEDELRQMLDELAT